MHWPWESDFARIKRLKAWHRKFLWLPTRLDDHNVYWLCFVNRRIVEVESRCRVWQYKENDASLRSLLTHVHKWPIVCGMRIKYEYRER